MLSTLRRLKVDKLINPPEWLIDNTHYLVQMGSVAYGVSGEDSDVDIYGFCIPKKSIIFPHTEGLIPGFDEVPGFDQWQQHHVKDPSNHNEYDFSVYNIIKYFRLVTNNNPNMIDSLFVPQRCVLHSTQSAEYLRDKRKVFLHKGAYHKFKGYAYSQLHKMDIKNPKTGSNRYEMVQKHGYDLKFAYHLVRFLNECEQILVEHDLDLEKNREQLKSIRRGEWTKEEIHEYFEIKERRLEELYASSHLQHSPNTEAIKDILVNCLESHYGSMSNLLKITSSREGLILNEISKLLENR